MKRLLFLTALALLVSVGAMAKGEKGKSLGLPEEYEVYQAGDWELQLFYWNKKTSHRIVHGVLLLRGKEMPNGNENDMLQTDLGTMRYVLRSELDLGMSGWVPDGGIQLEMYQVNKRLGANDLRRINLHNNPDLKVLTEEERYRKLQQQEQEWKYGPQSKEESEEEDAHEFTFE